MARPPGFRPNFPRIRADSRRGAAKRLRPKVALGRGLGPSGASDWRAERRLSAALFPGENVALGHDFPFFALAPWSEWLKSSKLKPMAMESSP